MLLKKCLKGWWRLLERNRHFRRSAPENRLMHSMFLKWRTLVKGEKYKRKQWIGNFKKLDRKMVHRRFLAYVEVVRSRKCVRGLITRQLQKSGRRLVNRCFQKWISFMQMGALKKVQQVEKFASAAEKENEKLRSDNERLSTIIDTGDWNKERVSDLKAAHEVLSTERVALTKLIGRLQRQHQSALDQQELQEHEIKQLKGQLVTENNYFERNKLLVKGASSFNTLMKVMKHDLTKKGMTAAPATPEVMYEVNNMAMDQVSVFPDGELHVKAFTPRSKGIWSNVVSNSGITRSPSVMSNRPVPGSPFSSVAPKKPRKSSLRAASPQTSFRVPTPQATFTEPSPPLPPKPSLRAASPQASFTEPAPQSTFTEPTPQASFTEPSPPLPPKPSVRATSPLLPPKPSVRAPSPPLSYNKYFREAFS
ncbi:hypothetical protein M758_12G152600 [Ceratodon purpureus]|nr:hypothetical protein M758_12G152600 [Ceratodon purpureus]